MRENVWLADRPFMWNTIDVGGRMTVIRVSGAAISLQTCFEPPSSRQESATGMLA